MARRIRLPCTRAQISQPLPIETDKDGRLTTQTVGQINAFMQAVTFAVNGHLSFGDGTQSEHAGNIDGQTIHVKTPATPDQEFTVPHGLERVPTGRIVLGQDLPGQLYDSNRAGWGVEKVFLKCDAASVTFLLALV
jgi:hypothetical protein